MLSIRKYKKEIIEWGIFLLIVGGLYFSGLGTPVASTLQRGVLMTGLFNASSEIQSGEKTTYNWKLYDLEGNEKLLSDFKGKPIFINLWATWCPPCRAEMPDIQKVYEEYGDQVVFLMVSVDDNSLKAKKFIESKDFTFPVYHANQSLPKEFYTTGIPATFVIDRSGNISYKKIGMANYNTEKFKSFLKSL